MKERLSEIAAYVKEHDVEFIFGGFVVGILGLMFKYPDAFPVEEEEDNSEKIVVEVHHHHHHD